MSLDNSVNSLPGLYPFRMVSGEREQEQTTKYQINAKRTLKKIITMLFNRIYKKGLHIINYQYNTDLTLPRPFEVAALFNKIPGIEFREKPPKIQ